MGFFKAFIKYHTLKKKTAPDLPVYRAEIKNDPPFRRHRR